MKRIKFIFFAVLIILCIPLIAMHIYPQEVHWTIGDFIIAGLLLFITGLSISMIAHHSKWGKKRIYMIAAILLLLFIIWAELAVGIFH